MLVLAIDEACTNVIRYAYENEQRHPMHMDMERLDDRVRFVLRDYGRSCDPAKIRSRALEDIRPGGVGVHIIKHVFDHVEYQPCSKGTQLILEKKLHSAPHDEVHTGANGHS
jgi:anti-sigma regulatory factor (Ser/Thr protein kinase)